MSVFFRFFMLHHCLVRLTALISGEDMIYGLSWYIAARQVLAGANLVACLLVKLGLADLDVPKDDRPNAEI